MRIWFLALLLTSCTSEQKSSRLHIAFNTHPHTKDPRLAADYLSSTMVCLLYEGLTRAIPGGGVEPALAESVTIEGNRYTFHLREAYWSDGTPITAYDFEKSWKEVLCPAKSCAFLFYPIKNAEKVVRGEALMDEVGIWAEDAVTFCVELERPTPYFYALTAFANFLPAPHAPNVFSGPFQIEQEQFSREITLKKNPTFWNQKNIELEGIHIAIIPDETTALSLFEQGQLDWIGGSILPLPLDALKKWAHRIERIPSAGSTLCTFNTNEFPFNNVHLRKAFSFSIDREEIAQNCHIAATSILPPCLSNVSVVLTDKELALQYFVLGLQELGIQKEALEEFPLYFRATQSDKRIAQTLQNGWQKLFGINIKLQELDFKSHTQKVQNKDYRLALTSWIAQFDDPVSFFDRFRQKEQLKNYPGWEDAAFVACLDEALLSKERDETLKQAESILLDALPLTPIYHWGSPVVKSPRIQKIATSACGGILFEQFKMDKSRLFLSHR